MNRSPAVFASAILHDPNPILVNNLVSTDPDNYGPSPPEINCSPITCSAVDGTM
ncbi:MAG: hypothetical protein ACE15E_02785 [Acidobacteriota bacterium]